jgi:hypothetical protein
MARPIEKDDVVFRRAGTNVLWMRYRDKDGIFRRESTLTEDRQEALRKLRLRLGGVHGGAHRLSLWKSRSGEQKRCE